MKIIGLTGPTGAGKSTLAKLAEARGWDVIDCDRSVRLVYESDALLRERLAAAFGREILDPTGQIDRKQLSSRAFCNPEATEQLNRIALPRIVLQIERQLAACGARFCLLDAPTLFESGLDARCSAVIAVLAGAQMRRDRIIARDTLTLEEASLRLSAGKSDTFYRRQADYILENDGGTAAFLEQASALLETLEKGDD